MVESRLITLEELRANKTKESLYLLLHNKVYDLTKFIDEHPGGDEVLLAEGGQDATEAFEDVGHSDEARALLPGMYIGDFEVKEGVKLKSAAAESQSVRVANVAVEHGSNMMYFLPLAFFGAYFAYRFYSTGSI